MTVHRVCESRGIDAFYNFANTARDNVKPEIQTIVAVQAQKEECRRGESKVSEQADLIRLHSQITEDVKLDQNVRVISLTRATQHLWARVCRLKHDVGQKVAEVTLCCVCESRGTNVSCTFDLDEILSKKRQAMVAYDARRGGSPWRFPIVERT